MSPACASMRLGVLVALLGQQHLVRLLVDPEVAGRPSPPAGASSFGASLVQPVIHLDVVVGLARDDERRARLVDQDRVDLVDDRVVAAPRCTRSDGANTMLSRR